MDKAAFFGDQLIKKISTPLKTLLIFNNCHCNKKWNFGTPPSEKPFVISGKKKSSRRP